MFVYIITQNDITKTPSIPTPLPTLSLPTPLILETFAVPDDDDDEGNGEEDPPPAAEFFAFETKASKLFGPDSTAFTAKTMPLGQWFACLQ